MKRHRHNCPACKAAHTCRILSVDVNTREAQQSAVHRIRCAKSGKSFTRTDTYNMNGWPPITRGTFAQVKGTR